MPNPNPPRSTKGFMKGVAANPRGSSERSRKLAAIKRLTIDELAEAGTLILNSNRGELEDIKANPNTSVLQYWLIGLIGESLKKGDMQAFDTFMTRLIGKPPDQPTTREALNMMKAPKEEGMI